MKFFRDIGKLAVKTEPQSHKVAQIDSYKIVSEEQQCDLMPMLKPFLVLLLHSDTPFRVIYNSPNIRAQFSILIGLSYHGLCKNATAQLYFFHIYKLESNRFGTIAVFMHFLRKSRFLRLHPIPLRIIIQIVFYRRIFYASVSKS